MSRNASAPSFTVASHPVTGRIFSVPLETGCPVAGWRWPTCRGDDEGDDAGELAAVDGTGDVTGEVGCVDGIPAGRDGGRDCVDV